MRYARYRKTGIPWLPEVPEEWEVHRVRNHYTVVSGSGFSPEIQGSAEGDFPVCKASDISNAGKELRTAANWISSEVAKQVGFHIMPLGSLLFPKIGEAMRKNSRAIAMVDCCADNNCQCLVPHNIDSGYTYYLFTQIDMNWFDNAGPVPCLSNKKLLGFSIPFPPLPTQRAIVAFLDEKCGKVDRLVAAKEKEAALLKELKQSMIAEAVTGRVNVANVKMLPIVNSNSQSTCAKATANKLKTGNIGNTGNISKSSGIPWLPEVPEGWEVRKVRQHFRLRSEKVSEKEFPPLSVAKIGVVPQLSDVAISMAEGDTRKLVREGDYVVNSRSDRKGSCGIAPRDGSVTTISIVLEPHDIDRKYVHYLFRSTPWVEEFYRNGRGIVADLWTTRYQEMRNMLFPLPPLPEQKAIVAYIEARAAKIDAAVAGLEREIAALKEYRERLIADVVTGVSKTPSLGNDGGKTLSFSKEGD